MKKKTKTIKNQGKKQVDALKVLKPNDLEWIEDQTEAIKDNKKQPVESDDIENERISELYDWII